MWTFAACTHACCLQVSVCLNIHTDCATFIFNSWPSGFTKDFSAPPSVAAFSGMDIGWMRSFLKVRFLPLVTILGTIGPSGR